MGLLPSKRNCTTSDYLNVTSPYDPCLVPTGLQFNEKNLVKIIINIIFCLLALVGNVALFFILLNNLRKNSNRVQRLILHMNIADLIVALFVLPSMIGNDITVIFSAPDWVCKLNKFVEALSVYLGSDILILITMDRFMSIMYPLYPIQANRKVRVGIWIAWLVAVLASLPQLYLFVKIEHPKHEWYTKCLDKNIQYKIKRGKGQISQEELEQMTNILIVNTVINWFMTYLLPFGVIIFCYSAIFIQMGITKRRASKRTLSGRMINSGQSNAFHLTAAMVVIFLLCWTPYFVAAVMKFFFQQVQFNEVVETILYLIPTFNSVANPYLYAYFSIDLKQELMDLLVFFRIRGGSRQHGQQNGSDKDPTAADNSLAGNSNCFLLQHKADMSHKQLADQREPSTMEELLKYSGSNHESREFGFDCLPEQENVKTAKSKPDTGNNIAKLPRARQFQQLPLNSGTSIENSNTSAAEFTPFYSAQSSRDARVNKSSQKSKRPRNETANSNSKGQHAINRNPAEEFYQFWPDPNLLLNICGSGSQNRHHPSTPGGSLFDEILSDDLRDYDDNTNDTGGNFDTFRFAVAGQFTPVSSNLSSLPFHNSCSRRSEEDLLGESSTTEQALPFPPMTISDNHRSSPNTIRRTGNNKNNENSGGNHCRRQVVMVMLQKESDTEGQQEQGNNDEQLKRKESNAIKFPPMAEQDDELTGSIVTRTPDSTNSCRL